MLSFYYIWKYPYFAQQSIDKKTAENKKHNEKKEVQEEKIDPTKDDSNIENLVKLSNLLKEGLITEEEYQTEKKKLLG